jgi:acyl-CoA synthetase (AMP-forming)/AMP-acid ligase II
MFELYGSTEAAISTFRRKGDPRGSVGEITDPPSRSSTRRARVRAGRARRRRQDHSTTRRRSARSAASPRTPASSRATSTTPDANSSKYRDGVYHSGDLGHILVRDGKRYPVLRRPHRRLDPQGRRELLRRPGRPHAPVRASRRRARRRLRRALRGVRRAGDGGAQAARRREFDPKGFFDWCEGRSPRRHGPQVVPDFVRMVDEFEYTQTQKVLVRNLKKRCTSTARRLPDAPTLLARARRQGVVDGGHELVDLDGSVAVLLRRAAGWRAAAIRRRQ